jgi:hypothetical protein
MKRVSLILFLFFSGALWGQTDTTSALEAMLTQSKNKQIKLKDSLDNRIKHPVYGLSFTFVVEKDFINLSAFNAWTNTNYHTKINPNIFSYGLNFGLMFKKYEFGVLVTSGYPYNFASFFVGRSIIRKPYFRSFIDFHIGTFSFGDFRNMNPPNYTLQPSQVGKDLILSYGAFACGLSLKGVFFTTHEKDGYFFNSFEIKSSYIPPKTDGWSYGYNEGRTYHGVSVTGIPNLPSFCTSLIYNIGVLGGGQVPD